MNQSKLKIDKKKKHADAERGKTSGFTFDWMKKGTIKFLEPIVKRINAKPNNFSTLK